MNERVIEEFGLRRQSGAATALLNGKFYRFKTDQLKMPDDFEVAPEW
jgi:hypothetical protein